MTKRTTPIYCCACKGSVDARLTDGAEIYPHRRDLKSIPFWRCDTCGGFVGCHYKAKKDKTQPLGVIATAEVKKARMQLHAALDPLWKSGKLTRRELYQKLSDKLGYEYHTGGIRSIEEAQQVHEKILEIKGDKR